VAANCGAASGAAVGDGEYMAWMPADIYRPLSISYDIDGSDRLLLQTFQSSSFKYFSDQSEVPPFHLLSYFFFLQLYSFSSSLLPFFTSSLLPFPNSFFY
jgi:hypothetical protein